MVYGASWRSPAPHMTPRHAGPCYTPRHTTLYYIEPRHCTKRHTSPRQQPTRQPLTRHTPLRLLDPRKSVSGESITVFQTPPSFGLLLATVSFRFSQACQFSIVASPLLPPRWGEKYAVRRARFNELLVYEIQCCRVKSFTYVLF